MSQDLITKLHAELEAAMELSKCKKCGCMQDALENLDAALPGLRDKASQGFENDVKSWLSQMESLTSSCRGCEHCYGAVATNILNDILDEQQEEAPMQSVEEAAQSWPPLPGEYFVLSDNADFPVAVTTLASIELAESLAASKPEGLAIVGKTETENIGIDKIVVNSISNPAIRYLIIAGKDPDGHFSGRTLLSLFENGVDENMKVIGSPGRRPILRNVDISDIATFRRQVKPINMIGIEDVETISEKIAELAKEGATACECANGICGTAPPVRVEPVSHVIAGEPKQIKLDKAGYFVIMPDPKKKIILVEHYSYDNKLLNIIEGKDARGIYFSVIENGWVSQLDHAAYLGKELEKAELSMKLGFKYQQDGA